METWVYVVSILGSLFLGVKLKSKCITKNCECSVERAETDDAVLRSVRIGRRAKVTPTPSSDLDRSIHNPI